VHAGAGAHAVLPECVEGGGAGELPERREADEQDGGERGAEAEEEGAPIERGRGEGGELGRGERDEEVEAPERDEHPGHAAEQAERAGFEQRIPQEMAAVGAEGDAHRGLVAAADGAGEQEVGEVGAGGEEHEADGGDEHEVERADLAGEVFGDRRRESAEAGVGVGILLLESGGDGREIGVGLREGDAGAEAAGDEEVVATAVAQGSLVVEAAEGHPQGVVQTGDGEAGGQHAEHGVRRAPQLDDAADDRGVGGEAALPESVAEDRGLGGTGQVFALAPEPAEDRLHA